MKKIIAIYIFIIAICAGLFAIFYYWQQGNGGGASSGTTNYSTSTNFPSSGSRNININETLSPNAATSSNNSSTLNNILSSLTVGQKFSQISDNQIAGATLVKGKTVVDSTIWYIERSTGFIFSYNPITGQRQRITETTLPNIYEAYWGSIKNEQRLILRYTKGSSLINSFVKINSATTSSSTLGQLTSVDLNPSINFITTSPDKSQYFYQLSSADGSTGFISNFSSTKNTASLPASPYPHWIVSWPEANTLVFQSAPGGDQAGFVNFYNLKTKTTSKKLSGLSGLTALVSPDAGKILYSSNDITGKPALRLLNLKTKVDIALGLNSLSEKCLWTSDSKKIYCVVPTSIATGTYPDDWYQGITSFSDAFWSIDSGTGKTEWLYNPESIASSRTIDGTNLFWGSKEDQLYLTNKKDGTLWLLNLQEQLPTINSQTKPNTSTSSK